MNGLKFAVFDMDGTLVDSRQVITRAMERAFVASGLPDPGYDRTRQIVGLSLHEAVARLAPPDMGPTQINRLVDRYKSAFIAMRSEPDFHEPLYAGALDTLERLKDEGWLIGIATGKARRGIEALFAHHPISGFFDAIRCADDGPGKPNPHMLELAMADVGAEPSQTLLIGDTTHDVTMGRAARVETHGVTWGFHTRDELLTADPHHVHEAFEELDHALGTFPDRIGAPTS